jgi:hypothetical protein
MQHVKHQLRALGYEICDTADGFRVVLPLFTSVDVTASNGELRVRARSGRMSRASAASLTFGSVALVPLLFVIPGFIGPMDLWLSEFATWLRYVFVLAAVWEVLRFIVSESMVIRVELLASRGAGGSARSE